MQAERRERRVLEAESKIPTVLKSKEMKETMMSDRKTMGKRRVMMVDGGEDGGERRKREEERRT